MLERTRFKKIAEDLKKRLKPSRYAHTVGVYHTAISLAMRYGVPLKKAAFAGLLHDCAKYGTDEEILAKCDKYGVVLTDEERLALPILHAKLGMYYAKERYGIADEDILNAISFHTTGRIAMSDLEKIIFVADYIEPGRTEAPRLDEIRAEAFKNMDAAICMIYEDTLAYLKAKNRAIESTTLNAFHYYKTKIGD
ncbi:MAG: HD domain-containing protein [Lachnospiraceae bacterium]|nr:HD domain-containing protein [Lachnospiraceae bacterium]